MLMRMVVRRFGKANWIYEEEFEGCAMDIVGELKRRRKLEREIG